MISEHDSRSAISLNRKVGYVGLAVFTLLFVLIGIYAVIIGTVEDNRILVLGFATPILLAILFTKYARQLFLALLVLSLALSARFRLAGTAFHTGGAEAALAPIDLAIIGLLVWMILESFRQGRELKVRLTLVELAFPILVIAQLPSLWIAPNPGLAVLELLRLMKMGVLLLLLKHYIRTRRDVKYVVLLLLLSVAAQGLLAIAQGQFNLAFGLGFLGERDSVWMVSSGNFSASRAGGTMGHANALAHFFEMTLPLMLAIVISRLPDRVRQVAFIALSLGLLGLYLTLSRGGWGATLAGFAIVFAGNHQWHVKRYRKRLLLNMLLILVVLLVLGLVLWPTIEQRITEFSSTSWIFRLRTYEVALEIVREHPWLGIGANNYLQVAIPYNVRILRIWPEAIVHNMYLLLLTETGILGLSAFGWFLISIWRHSRRVIRSSDPLQSTVALGAWAGICALLVHGFLGWLFRYDPVYTLFWFYVGLLVAISQLQDTEGVAKAETT